LVRAVANQLLQHLRCDAAALCVARPDVDVVKALVRLAWAGSGGDYRLLAASWRELGSMPLLAGQKAFQDEYCEDVQLCR